jgi:hypothetical protein
MLQSALSKSVVDPSRPSLAPQLLSSLAEDLDHAFTCAQRCFQPRPNLFESFEQAILIRAPDSQMHA